MKILYKKSCFCYNERTIQKKEWFMDKAYIRFPDFRIKALTLSYDDGVRQDKRLIEIMKNMG